MNQTRINQQTNKKLKSNRSQSRTTLRSTQSYLKFVCVCVIGLEAMVGNQSKMLSSTSLVFFFSCSVSVHIYLPILLCTYICVIICHLSRACMVVRMSFHILMMAAYIAKCHSHLIVGTPSTSLKWQQNAYRQISKYRKMFNQLLKRILSFFFLPQRKVSNNTRLLLFDVFYDR